MAKTRESYQEWAEALKDAIEGFLAYGWKEPMDNRVREYKQWKEEQALKPGLIPACAPVEVSADKADPDSAHAQEAPVADGDDKADPE
jgi:hypothetical protein